ncbi:Uridine nucleosidase 1 [Vermiconidia calcicola]|uniref:Uridine nucleosidase 1 n=1 Tax=Vermiconidia calcicola TaxID=1690605 RepID=A0ACC3NUX0_9PEZI|nr:Uridine nucleosidase 1 [Vermiconidia calcicola]
MTDQPTPIWLDCDTGHDDAFAILVAACHPQVELLGISTTYVNASLAKTTYNTRAILKAIGREKVPVYAGAAKPFCREASHAPDIHGESGLDGTTCLPIPDVPVRTDKTAVDAMYDALISTPKGSAWVVPCGASTNAALLFATHPDLVNHIGGVSIMGGAIGDDFTDAPMGTVKGQGERFGNITPYAEFNIYIDPESAKSMLSNNTLAGKTTLIALDLTHRFLATPEIQKRMLHGHEPAPNGSQPSRVRKLFLEITTFFAKTYADVFGITIGPPVHDVLAVVAAFAPTVFIDHDGEKFEVSVVTEGPHGMPSAAGRSQCGRTIATPALPAFEGVRIPRDLDADQVWRMIDQCLGIAERQEG